MKIKVSVLAALLAMLCTACSSTDQNSSVADSSTPAEQLSQSSVSAERSDDEEETQTIFSVASDVIDIRVEFNKALYTHDMAISTSVTIDNHSDKRLFYVQGSGSNLIPDALSISLGELADTFHPAAVTMDYQIDILEPGQKLEFQLDFVPYIATNHDQPTGTDRDISFFRDSEDYIPAEAGTVVGKAAFEYFLIPEGNDEQAPLLNIEEQESNVVTVDMFTKIQ